MPFHHKHFPTFIHLSKRARERWAVALQWERFVVQFVATAIVVYALYFWLVSAPFGFPQGAYVTVAEGEPLSAIAADFKARDIISHPWLFIAAARIVGSDRHIPAGTYYFSQPQNLVLVAIRLTSGDFETTPIRVMVPEGATNEDIASLLTSKVPGFDRGRFVNAAQGKEGYLYPDTYFFMPGDSTQTILSVFNNGFQSHISKVQSQLTAFGKPLPDVLTMASLVEKEASTMQDRQMIAGILWHRLQIGMPLQVDAVFPYILHKSALDLTHDDLAVDSPYNTYTNKGLPPGPIGNPTIAAITAVVTPTKSNYVYYLSDKDGIFHYAVTYAQHVANIKKYYGS